MLYITRGHGEEYSYFTLAENKHCIRLFLITSLHFSLGIVARAVRRRSDGVLGPEDGEGVVDTTSSRLEGERSIRADASTTAVDRWREM